MSFQTVDDSIIEAANSLIGSVGEDFTIAHLATATGLSRATLYRKIGSKDALLVHLKSQGTKLNPGTRARIISAAQMALGEHGFLSTNMEQIALAAQVGVATVYRHFGDKDSLVRAVIEEVAAKRLLRQISLKPSNDPREDLTRLVEAVLAALTDMGGLMRLSLFGNPAEQAYLTQLRQGTDRTLDLLERYVKAQVVAGRFRSLAKPRSVALGLMGLVISFGVIGPTRYDAPLEDLEGTATLIVSMFLDGLLLEEVGNVHR